jgi:hypothetical protein
MERGVDKNIRWRYVKSEWGIKKELPTPNFKHRAKLRRHRESNTGPPVWEPAVMPTRSRRLLTLQTFPSVLQFTEPHTKQRYITSSIGCLSIKSYPSCGSLVNSADHSILCFGVPTYLLWSQLYWVINPSPVVNSNTKVPSSSNRKASHSLSGRPDDRYTWSGFLIVSVLIK